MLRHRRRRRWDGLRVSMHCPDGECEAMGVRADIVVNPPDILLPNYVMAELILTRTHERPLVEAAHGLQCLVLDELHTYRGRQGADVAMLIRRIRECRCGGPPAMHRDFCHTDEWRDVRRPAA